MTACLIIYASMTGNTEELATLIGEGIESAGGDVTMVDILDANASDLLGYEGVLLGAYTWGDGELPDEFLDFYLEMDELQLNGIRAAAFGSCDSSYEYVGRAVDILAEKLSEAGAEIILPGLKIEHVPTLQERQQCIEFGQTFVAKMNGN